MKINCADSAGRQRGVALLEGLIGTLLLSIVFLGGSHALSITLVSQRHMNAQNLAVLELREKTAATGIAGLCSAGSDSITVGQQSLSIAASNCTNPLITVSVGNFDVDIGSGEVGGVGASVSTTSGATSMDYFGGDGVVTFSYQ